MKKRDLTPEEKAECARLKSIYMRKRADLGLTQEALAEQLNMSQAGLSMYLNGRNAINLEFAFKISRLLEVAVGEFSPRIAAEINGPGGAGKVVGAIWDESLQRSLTSIRLPSDVSEAEQVVDIQGLPSALAQKIRDYKPVVLVPRYDVSASMGPGIDMPEMNMVVENMSLDARWVRQNLTFSALENLRLICGRGDSMSPTIRNGDAVMIDIGITAVESDAIYFFQLQGQLLIKRIQRNLDGFSIISDNAQYRDLPIPAARANDIHILAQVIYWWNGRSF
ncbi:putative phage repressor [Pseudomonas syringae pv. maculicola]|uniref:LexA family transcriptional regulator n=1 Tax=Pseudomonas syringae group genomosp. 3 TaxID=251701 RepID=UPI0006B8A247|nr:LexA family transcriptional regulator [Pseudomonas syringae group genomosp. 3]KPB92867.1 putative phage repressor [Pseudomonas syringae pv. maculicola]MBM0211846.1 helix-turn-helix domain-containing protein [Pseudomonas syringae pv. maculicola]RMM83763.1 putative phage repressor [Pseudomonas syringae pv. maculicola]